MKLFLCFLALMATPGRSQALAGPRADITIYYQFVKHQPPTAILEALELEATAILSPMGRHIEWRSIVHANDGHLTSELAVVKFIGTCDPSAPLVDGFDDRLGWTHITNGEILPFSDVDCDSVRRFIDPKLAEFRISDREIAFGKAAGRVVAHELYHVFAQTRRHQADGVNKSRFTVSDLLAETLRIEEPALQVRESLAPIDEPKGSQAGRLLFAQRGCPTCHGMADDIPVCDSGAAGRMRFNVWSVAAKLSDKTTKMSRAAKKLRIRWQSFSQTEMRNLVEFLNTSLRKQNTANTMAVNSCTQ